MIICMAVKTLFFRNLRIQIFVCFKNDSLTTHMEYHPITHPKPCRAALLSAEQKVGKDSPKRRSPSWVSPPGERLLEWGEMAGIHRWDFTYYIGKKSGDDTGASCGGNLQKERGKFGGSFSLRRL